MRCKCCMYVHLYFISRQSVIVIIDSDVEYVLKAVGVDLNIARQINAVFCYSTFIDSYCNWRKLHNLELTEFRGHQFVVQFGCQRFSAAVSIGGRLMYT